MGGDFKLPLRPARAPAVGNGGPILRNHIPAPSALNKRAGNSAHVQRAWVRVDAATGAAQAPSLDRLAVMRRCRLPPRDLRLLDPLLFYPPAVLRRDSALVVNLERVRCVVTADEALVLVGPENGLLGGAGEAESFAREVQRRLVLHGGEKGDLPFELVVLEAALDAACVFLDDQATQVEKKAYPLLDGLASNISTTKLEGVRRLKKELVALTMRVQKVRDGIQHLMDDEDDMASMYLTEKKKRMEAALAEDEQPLIHRQGASSSAPVSPASSSSHELQIERNFSITTRSRPGNSAISSERDKCNTVELEMLLEAYFVAIDSTLSKLTSLKEYIDDTEVSQKQDNIRNQLINFELLLTVAAFVAGLLCVVSGVFGMNFDDPVFLDPDGFQWVIVMSGVGAAAVFCGFLLYFKQKKLLPL